MAQINQYLSLASRLNALAALPCREASWRAQCRPFAPHNTHFRYPAVTRDPIARTDGHVALRGTR
jgi:hypothetical protein